MKCIDAALSRFNAVHDYPGEERLDERRFRLADVEGRPILGADVGGRMRNNAIGSRIIIAT
jgi:hypothetical protein